MIYLQNNPTAAYGLFIYSNGQGQAISFRGVSYSPSAVPVRVAGYMILIGPIFALFMIFKNKLMGNLTEGGLKG
jgi:ABC-type maltose transport system permease subunit